MLDILCVGHASFDVTMTAPHHPGADEKMRADALTLGGGGPAANAAVQVARLGGRAGFCGYLGNDIFGEAHLAELATEGVDTSLIVRGSAPTPVSQILAKPDGARSLVNFKADTPWLPATALTPNRVEALKPRVLLFDGHEPLLSDPLCQWAKKQGVATVLDAGSVHKGTHMLAGAVDYLVASEKFACAWCETDDPEKALPQLAKLAPVVAITRGARGTLWSRHGEQGCTPAFIVHAVDSTGAGDAFHGAFSLAVARSMGWQETLRFASAAGALACTRLGARTAQPDAEQVGALLDHGS